MPGLTKDLLSVAQFGEEGFDTTFGGGIAAIHSDATGEVLLEGSLQRGSFLLTQTWKRATSMTTWKSAVDPANLAPATASISEAELWDRRLGNVGVRHSARYSR